METHEDRRGVENSLKVRLLSWEVSLLFRLIFKHAARPYSFLNQIMSTFGIKIMSAFFPTHGLSVSMSPLSKLPFSF
ncbi:hypothetical protein AT59_21880 [Aeromonas hydrophila AD9]|nr:hypothetical protein AT59_21880 [Aeromonas hydrophila AD9]